jgi:hypothetical protein
MTDTVLGYDIGRGLICSALGFEAASRMTLPKVRTREELPWTCECSQNMVIVEMSQISITSGGIVVFIRYSVQNIFGGGKNQSVHSLAAGSFRAGRLAASSNPIGRLRI